MESHLGFQPYSNTEVKTALEVDEQQDSISSLIPDFGKVNLNSEPISSEDAAWIDSCFISNSGLPGGNLDLLKDALRRIVDSDFASFASLSTQEHENISARSDDETLIGELEATEVPAGEGLQFQDDIPYDLMSTFLDLDDIESVEDITLGPLEDLESPENIFQVWDLETHFEEDELSKELNRAIVERIPSFSSPEIENLISGMADLSF
ncbi:hypothetical protein H6P81_018784 [Aristolochia fimbriata]|uniref:Uncharacterized protein n=1 Tax=Aristolochia fimbriata TaxID=158543 RepID=A0AAV7E483_ARIFI|nr:hypothetical protein H6P81_018784 [Aristolochia fimbriata]